VWDFLATLPPDGLMQGRCPTRTTSEPPLESGRLAKSLRAGWFQAIFWLCLFVPVCLFAPPFFSLDMLIFLSRLVSSDSGTGAVRWE
jgi:hypothetical protein